MNVFQHDMFVVSGIVGACLMCRTAWYYEIVCVWMQGKGDLCVDAGGGGGGGEIE